MSSSIEHPKSRYLAEREARVRGGVRLIVAAAIVPCTWLVAAWAWMASWAAGLRQPADSHSGEPLLLRALVVLLIGAACAGALGLLRGARWRLTAFGAWAGILLGTVLAIIYPQVGQGAAGDPFTVAGIAVVILATLTWALLEYDPPAI